MDENLEQKADTKIETEEKTEIEQKAEKKRLEFTVGYFEVPKDCTDLRDYLRPYECALELEFFPRDVIDYSYEAEDRIMPRYNIDYLRCVKENGMMLVKLAGDLKNITECKRYELRVSLVEVT